MIQTVRNFVLFLRNQKGINTLRQIQIVLALTLFMGCETLVPVKNFDCGDWNEDKTGWYCRSRVTGKCIENKYVESAACEGIEVTP